MVTVVGGEVELSSAPIPRDWVTGGTPQARNSVLAVSADRTALTLLWDCTGGSFRWIYDQDETIHILEGAVTLTLQDGRTADLAPGSIVFFPAGSVVHWTVHGYVRKLAVFRESMPAPVAIIVRLQARARRILRSRVPVRAPSAPQPMGLPQAA
jgi:uncharacterized cupin superfamily protein